MKPFLALALDYKPVLPVKLLVDFFKYLLINKMEDKIGEIPLYDF